MPLTKINLQDLAGGSVAERIDIELQKIFENIADPNTDAKKPRKLQINLTFKADANRDIANISVQVKPTPVPAKDIETKAVIDLDENGMITGAELKSKQKGQTYIDEEGDIADDKGQKIKTDERSEKVVDLRAQK